MTLFFLLFFLFQLFSLASSGPLVVIVRAIYSYMQDIKFISVDKQNYKGILFFLILITILCLLRVIA